MRPTRELGRAGGAGASSATPGQPAVSPLGGELGERYHAQKRDFLGIGLSCLPDEAFLDAVRQAVAASVPEAYRDLNLRAFDKGFDYGARALTETIVKQDARVSVGALEL